MENTPTATKPPTLKELSRRPDQVVGGHRACTGCGGLLAARQAAMVSDKPMVVGAATGCLEVCTTIFPYTAWQCSFIHSAFENSAATISGVEAAYRSLRHRGRLSDEFRFLALGGDGGTYDIGFQSLSGAMERGHRMLYICYDNGAYMNTGIQRSSATPQFAHTTTSPAGKAIPGKMERRKDLTACMVAHELPYIAQATPGRFTDYIRKVHTALETDGPTFINVLSPCPLGWGTDPSQTLALAREAVECCYWPLYEVVEGKYKITYRPKEKTPVAEWLKKQVRFKHLFQKGNEELLAEFQRFVDQKWEQLLRLAGEG